MKVQNRVEFASKARATDDLKITISSAQVGWTLSVIVGFLILAGVVAQIIASSDSYFPLSDVIARYFILDGEANLAAWYSSISLFVCFAFLGFIGYTKRQSNGRYAIHWIGLAFIFAILSIDESLAIHERYGFRIAGLVFDFAGQTSFGWVIPGAILVTAMAWIYSKFIFHLPSKTRNLVIAAGGVYVFGALILEIIGWRLAYSPNAILNDMFGLFDNLYNLVTIFEEGMEMIGVALLLYALTTYVGGVNLKGTAREY